MSREALFPACASFGPILIVMGCVFPPNLGSFAAFFGAGATSYALLTLYKMLAELHPQADAPQTSTSEAEASNL